MCLMQKKQSMQQFYIDFGNYLEDNGNQLNGDRSYETIRGTIEAIINNNPEVYNIGGASSKSKIKKLFKTDYKVFKNNLIALFDDKANGELNGELYTPKKTKSKSRRVTSKDKDNTSNDKENTSKDKDNASKEKENVTNNVLYQIKIYITTFIWYLFFFF